ncbi:MAG TPA: DUF488 domain-containing protein [Syntrophales bacterium]|jgi:uncharacterized protein YeaO (DUF488 family)|nr:DUF488 domain-containing protein [Syntrophales bacterium]HRT60789.1 DUF488 domain-containing protein [Syntrophales bacterium]
MLKIKRIYDPASPGDGRRILVDRLWPRGIRKEDAAIDEWLKELAPSAELRKWFAHDPAKWSEFQKRYRKELQDRSDVVDRLRKEAGKRTVTLLYSARDEKHNNAVVLKDIITG